MGKLESEYGVSYKVVYNLYDLFMDDVAVIEALGKDVQFVYRVCLPYSEDETYMTGLLNPELLGME